MKKTGLASLGVLVILAAGCDRSEPRLRKVHTEHLGKLTGSVLNAGQGVGINGTDLGVSFGDPANRNRLIFLFGDTWTTDENRRDEDASAFVSTERPEQFRMPQLRWVQARSGQFAATRIQGVSLTAMETPLDGVVANGKIYVFAGTEWNEDAKRQLKLALAHTSGLAYEPDGLSRDFVSESDKFLSVSAFNENGTVWIFGSGTYRKSSVYLAKVDERHLGDRDKWQYLQTGAPTFGEGEASAVPVVISNCVGELSVRKHRELGYLMLYNCDADVSVPRAAGRSVPRGIHLRRADQPWGPWDPPISVFDPGADDGFGHFIHQKTSSFAGATGIVNGVHYDDGLAEPGVHRNGKAEECQLKDAGCCGFGLHEECGGALYGPYLVPQWFGTTADGGYSIVYTLSTWIPYQVHLMRTILAKRDDQKPQPPAQRGTNVSPPRLTNADFGGTGACTMAGWHPLGDAFRVFKGVGGRCRVTSFSLTTGDAATGAIFQNFTVDASTKAIRFLVHGGEGTVRLHKDAEILRETRGRSGHEPWNFPDTAVCWQLSEYAGEALTLAIFDGKKGPWGFIGATGFEFLTTPCG